MEKTYNPALIQRTQRYMETHSISQNQFAAKVNLSSAALSSYLNQKYKGSVEAVERQLSEFFKLDPQQGRHLWRCSGSGQACRNPCQQRKSCHFSFAEHHCWPCQQWRCRRSCCGLQGTRHDGRQLH